MASKTLASLVVRIGADVTGVTAGMSSLDKRIRSTKREFSSLRDSTLSWGAALKAATAGVALGLAAKRIFDVGAAVEETASKFRTTLGPATGEAQKFLNEFANTAGLTNRKGQDLLATTAAIAQGMGFTQRASAAFSEQIVRLSADLSSFNNIPIEETSKAVQSALTGEREGLKKFGIVINEVDVQRQAFLETGKKTAAALTQQEKATATLALITQKAGVAVGDLARTMDSPANQARALQAAFLDVGDSLAHGMLPAMGVVLAELGRSVGSFKHFGQTIEGNSGRIAAWARFAVEAFKTVAKAIAAPIRIAFNLGEMLGKVLTAGVQAMKGNFTGAKATLSGIATDFLDIQHSVTGVIHGFDNMVVASTLAWDAAADGPAEVIEKTQAFTEQIKNTTGAVVTLKGALTGALEGASWLDAHTAQLKATQEEYARLVAAKNKLLAPVQGTVGTRITTDSKSSNAEGMVDPPSGKIQEFLKQQMGSFIADTKRMVWSALNPLNLMTDVFSRALGDFLKNLMPIVDILASALMPILKALFPAFKLLAIGATYVGQVLFKVSEGLGKAIGYTVYAIGKVIDSLPFVSGKKIMDFGKGMIAIADGFGEAASALGDARDEIRALEWQEAGDAVADFADAARKAADELATYESLAVRGFKAVGLGVAGDRASMTFGFRQEIADLKDKGAPPELIQWAEYIQGLERQSFELDQAFAAQTAAIQAAADAQISALDKQIGIAQDQLSVAQESLSAQQQFVDDLRNVVDALRRSRQEMLVSDLSPLSPIDRLNEARRQFQMMGQLALGGDLTAAASLPEMRKQLLELSRAVNSVGGAFVADFNSSDALIAAVEAQMTSSLSIEEQILAELKGQTSQFDAQIKAMQAQQKAIRDAADLQIGALQQELANTKAQMAQAYQEALEKVQVLKDSLEAMKDVKENTGIQLWQARNDLNNATTKVIPAIHEYYLNLLRDAGVLGTRASGGPVGAGVPYLVGERGPEMFVPSGSGSIVPNHALGGEPATDELRNVARISQAGAVEIVNRLERLIEEQIETQRQIRRAAEFSYPR